VLVRTTASILPISIRVLAIFSNSSSVTSGEILTTNGGCLGNSSLALRTYYIIYNFVLNNNKIIIKKNKLILI